MLVKLFASAVFGVDAQLITIEVDVRQGTKQFIVGLPDNTVKESLQRIESAVKNNGFNFTRKKIVINLAPADVRKEGSAYDLPMAIGILAASGNIENTEKLSKYLIMGELSLDGSLRPLRGALPVAIMALKMGFEGFILPKENATEAAIVNKLKIYGVENLAQAVDFLNNKIDLKHTVVNTRELFEEQVKENLLDFSDVKGQKNIKRALEISAAGGHNVILIGPPGSGKTMLAKRIPTILPPLSLYEALETTKIYSVAGILPANTALIASRPFRAPHHTISDVALVGGGNMPQPGEISLAQNGVLFLDELPEFKRNVLEVLRQPLEERKVTISRAKFTVQYPANFMLVSSMNPCPCGYYNHPEKECVCSVNTINRYLNKISGPLLDRIDLHVEVVPVNFEDLTRKTQEEKSEYIRSRVIKAREIQKERFEKYDGVLTNSQMESKMLREYAKINQAGKVLLERAMNKLNLSARAYDRILKVARTIADLQQSDDVKIEHIAEAINFRSLDRQNWAG